MNPPAALVFKLWERGIPLPEVCVMVAAVMLPAVRFPTLPMVKLPSRFVPPTVPKVIFPVPAESVTSFAPSITPSIVDKKGDVLVNLLK